MKKFLEKNRFFVRIVLFITFLLIYNYAGGRYLPDNDWELWGLVIFAVIVLIPQGLVFPVIRSLGYKHEDSPCLANSNICCVEHFKESLSQKFGSSIILDDETMRTYHLTRFSEMLEISALFASKETEKQRRSFSELIQDEISDKRLLGIKKEIWYFSSEISADSFVGKIQNIPEVHDESIKYIYFYINKKPASEREKTKLNEMKNAESEFVFIPISTQRDSSSRTINILPEMLGSVVFIFKEKESASFSSYFVLKSETKDSVYFRMPYCMNDDYYSYLKSLVDGGAQ